MWARRRRDAVVSTEESFVKYHDRIYRYILGMVRSRAETEDLTQETFLRALGAEGSVRDPGAVRGWLYRIATNVCVDRLRQRKPQVSIDSDEGAAHVKLVASASPSAAEIAERNETSACVH